MQLRLQSVAVCGDCFEVAGPANSSVALYDYRANSTSTFQLQLEWDPAYLGPLSVDVLPPVRWRLQLTYAPQRLPKVSL